MNKHSQLISSNVFSVSPHKVEAIKSVATQAILTSVVASSTEKEDIITNTHSHIDKSFSDKKTIQRLLFH